MNNLNSGEEQLLNLLLKLEEADSTLQSAFENINFSIDDKDYIIKCQWQNYSRDISSGHERKREAKISIEENKRKIDFTHSYERNEYRDGIYHFEGRAIINYQYPVVYKFSYNDYEPTIEMNGITYRNNRFDKGYYQYKMRNGKVYQENRHDASDYCYFDHKKDDLYIHMNEHFTTLKKLKQYYHLLKTKTKELQREIPSSIIKISTDNELDVLKRLIEKYEDRKQELFICENIPFQQIKINFNEEELKQIAVYLQKYFIHVREQYEEENIRKRLSDADIAKILKIYGPIE